MRLSGIFIVYIAFVLVDARSIRYEEEADFMCSKTTPCAWEVYRPYDRRPEYFMKSPCECPENTKCVQSADDISISAYVYHCRED